MKRVVWFAALLVLQGIYCRSISIPSESLTSSDEQHGHFDSVLKREKKSTLSSLEPPFQHLHLNAHGLTEQLMQALKPPLLPKLNIPGMNPLPELPGLPIPAPLPQPIHNHEQPIQHGHEQQQLVPQHSPLPGLPMHNHEEHVPHNHGQEQQVIPTLSPLPKHPHSDDFIKKLRQMFDDNDAQNVQDFDAPSARLAPVAPLPLPYVPQYVTPYQQYPQPSCGSNLLIGCQPQVQAVPCYGPPLSPLPSYGSLPHAPPAQPLPPPPPPQPSYALSPQSYGPPAGYGYGYGYSSNPPSSPPYFIPAHNSAAVDVYSKPGPPYAEPSLGSTLPISRDQWQYTITNEKDAPIEPRKDSNPESSNIEKKTESSTTSLMPKHSDQSIATTTETTFNTTTKSKSITLSQSNEDQLNKLSAKLENHVDSLEQFKEVAGKRLRDAMERSNSAMDDFGDIEKYFRFSSPTLSSKRHSIKNSHTDPQVTNSVW